MRSVAVASAALVMALVAPASASHSIASFFTPERAAYCKWHVPLDYRVAT
jgi:hypothetical protein